VKAVPETDGEMSYQVGSFAYLKKNANVLEFNNNKQFIHLPLAFVAY